MKAYQPIKKDTFWGGKGTLVFSRGVYICGMFTNLMEYNLIKVKSNKHDLTLHNRAKIIGDLSNI